MTADEAVALVNTLLADANALPQLVKHDGWDYHIDATSPDVPLADRMAVDAAMAIADVIRVGEFGRLRVVPLTTARSGHRPVRTAPAAPAAPPVPTASTWRDGPAGPPAEKREPSRAS